MSTMPAITTPALAGARHANRASRWLALPLLAIAGLFLAIHLLTLHEGSHWTSPLLLGDWLFTIMLATGLLVYALALGRHVARPLLGLDDDRGADTLAALGLGFGILSLSILFAGFLRLYYGPLFLAAGVALTLWLRADLLLLLEQARMSIVAWQRAGLPTLPTRGQRLVLLVLVLTLPWVLMRTMLPLSDWDAVVYHMAAPKLYLELHRIVPLPDLSLANAPSGEEMLYIVGLFAGSDGIGKLLNLLFAILLGLATVSLGRQLFDRAAAWLGVLLLFSTFWFLAVVPLTLVDCAGAFLLVLGLRDLCAWANALGDSSATRRTHIPIGIADRIGTTDRLLARAGLLLGLAISCKLTNIAAIPTALAATGLLCLMRNGLHPMQRIILAIRCATIIGLGALLVLSPWLLKNWYFFGHPLYPAAVTASTPSHGVQLAATQPPLFTHLHWIGASFVDFFWHHVSYLTVLLIAAPFVLRRPAARLALIFLLLGTFVWLIYVPFYEPPRYYLGLTAIADALSAATAYALWQRLRLRPALLDLLLATLLLSLTLPTLFIGLRSMEGPDLLHVANGTVSRYDYLGAHVRPYLAEQWANAHAPSGSIALVNVLPSYYIDGPHLADWYGARLSRLITSATTRQTELTQWCRANVQMVVFDRGDGSPDRDIGAIIRPLGSFAWIHTPALAPRVVFSANGIDVLLVHPCAALQRNAR